MKDFIPYSIVNEVEKEKRDFVKQKYLSAVEEVGPDEYKYIKNKGRQKVISAQSASTAWIVEMAICYSALFEVFDAVTTGKEKRISSKNIKFIAASLFYFINPFDVIPDFTPATGYIDDLIVLITCVKAMPEKEYRVLNKYFKKNAKELCYATK